LGNIAHLAAYRRDRCAATFRLGLERCAFNGAISSTPTLVLLHPQLPTLALCVSTSRFCSQPASCSAANNRLLFDHLVGVYHQGEGHFEAERLGGFQVDDEF
jgi:hypothetical protein